MASMDDFFAAAKAVANDPASLIMRVSISPRQKHSRPGSMRSVHKSR